MKLTELAKIIKEEIVKAKQLKSKQSINGSGLVKPMSKSDLDKIRNSKTNDIISVQSDWSPQGIKMVQVKLLEPFKPVKNAPGFYHAFVNYKNRLEMTHIDYDDMTAYIGGNWDDQFEENELNKYEKQFNLKISESINESIKDKLSDIKDKDNQNKIDKIKSLMGVLEDEGKAFQGLAKAAKDAFTEHDYDKLKAEADRFEQMAKDSEAKYKKLEAELKKLEGEKKSEKKEDKKEDKKINEGIHDRDILSRPLSNPDVKPLNRSSEELGKEADSRSENMLRMKYQKQIADPKISDDELRYLLGGSGEKAFGGRPNAIEKIIKNRNKLDEGIWSVLPKRIPEFIKAVENLKDKYHGVVGSDAVFDGLDSAIIEAERLLANSSKMKEGKNLNKAKSPKEKLDERVVYRTAEFEEIDSSLDKILDNLYVFEDKEVKDNIIRYINKIQRYIESYGFMNIDENLNERDMSKKEEKIVLKLKKSKGDFKKRYGKDAEKVMYATATKLANK